MSSSRVSRKETIFGGRDFEAWQEQRARQTREREDKIQKARNLLVDSIPVVASDKVKYANITTCMINF